MIGIADNQDRSVLDLIGEFAVRVEILMPVRIPMRKGDEEYDAVGAGDERLSLGIEITNRFTHHFWTWRGAHAYEEDQHPDQDRDNGKDNCDTWKRLHGFNANASRFAS